MLVAHRQLIIFSIQIVIIVMQLSISKDMLNLLDGTLQSSCLKMGQLRVFLEQLCSYNIVVIIL